MWAIYFFNNFILNLKFYKNVKNIKIILSLLTSRKLTEGVHCIKLQVQELKLRVL